MNNLLMFSLIAFLTAGLITLNKEKKESKEVIKLQDEYIQLQDSLILELQSSNRIYIDKALGNI